MSQAGMERSSMMELQANAVSKWYLRGKGDSNRFFAVRSASLRLYPGTVTVLTGRSGSGKTTLMNMMSGLLTPEEGSVLLDGQELYTLKDDSLSRLRNRHFGMIPQGADTLPDLTAMENILLPQGIWNHEDASLSAAQDRARDLMEQMEISHLADVPARELSGGERRRVCMARALAGNGEFLFADEPTSDLDDENTRIILSMLRKMADGGCSVMIVTHDNEALDYADRKYRMDGGSISAS